jgi:hypothetical protein
MDLRNITSNILSQPTHHTKKHINRTDIYRRFFKNVAVRIPLEFENYGPLEMGTGGTQKNSLYAGDVHMEKMARPMKIRLACAVGHRAEPIHQSAAGRKIRPEDTEIKVVRFYSRFRKLYGISPLSYRKKTRS